MSKGSVFQQLVQEVQRKENDVSYLDDAKFYKVFPCLHDMLFAKKAFGKPRDPGRLAIFLGDGRITVCLTCPSEGVCTFLDLDCLSELPSALETALAEGTLVWRKTKGKKATAAKAK